MLIGETTEDIFGCFDLKVGSCLREGYVGSWAHTSSLPCGRSEGGLPETRNRGPRSLPQGPLKDRCPYAGVHTVQVTKELMEVIIFWCVGGLAGVEEERIGT